MIPGYFLHTYCFLNSKNALFMMTLWVLYFDFSIRYNGRPKSTFEEEIGSGGWNRTNDLQVMSLTSYLCSTPRYDLNNFRYYRAFSITSNPDIANALEQKNYFFMISLIETE